MANECDENMRIHLTDNGANSPVVDTSHYEQSNPSRLPGGVCEPGTHSGQQKGERGRKIAKAADIFANTRFGLFCSRTDNRRGGSI